jgi:hypothetical protein
MKNPASNAILIDVGTLQAASPTMQLYILQMAEQGRVVLFDPFDVQVIFDQAQGLPRDQPYISVADTCRLLNGEIPGFPKINIL